ncbi:hypothetical protein MKW92_010484 [Papaver armeniacum]|nr:hypothetical protein MKW92_010484 [Papaver armeniacum]
MIALDRRKFLKNAETAVHRQAMWSNLAHEMTAEFHGSCAEKAYLQQELEKLQDLRNKAKLDGELWGNRVSSSLDQNLHLHLALWVANGFYSVVEFDPSIDTELQITSADSSKNNSSLIMSLVPTEIKTGTGKTYTMEGTLDDKGVNYRTLEELFRILEERSDTMWYDIFVSILEVYNERICDLLVDESNQHPRNNQQWEVGTQEVPGLVIASVHNTVEVWELLQTGSRNRVVGSINYNELSSLSHCLFRVTVKGDNLVNGQRTRSPTGSTKVEGERLKESQFINKSLFALGDVISALASNTSHIPYKSSKFTHLLQSSLGGDCKTLMFVKISPSSADSGETLCSLNFASRVKVIEHGPARKQSDPTEIFKLKQNEKETNKLQDSLAPTEKKPPLGPSKLRPPLRGITNFIPPPSPLQPYKVVATDHPTFLLLHSIQSQIKVRVFIVSNSETCVYNVWDFV